MQRIENKIQLVFFHTVIPIYTILNTLLVSVSSEINLLATLVLKKTVTLHEVGLPQPPECINFISMVLLFHRR